MTIRIEHHRDCAAGPTGAVAPTGAATGPVLMTRITLDRAAKGNSLSSALVAELATALSTAARDGTRLLLIDADGPNFCTGFDLANLDDENDDSLLARIVRVELLLQQLYRARCLTVAVAQGRAWGAGADLFAACSQRWVRDDAGFSFPGAGFGLVLGTARLAARVGSAQAEAWVTSGLRFDAPTALSAGLATRRLAATDPVADALDIARSTARLDDVTLASIREAAAFRPVVDDAVDLERLVRSAARPGLGDRIRAYRAALTKRR